MAVARGARGAPVPPALAGQTTSRLGDALTGVALAFAVLDVGGSASALGVVLASFLGARAAFILVGGVWADRLPRRLVMLACDGVRAVVQGAVAVALLTDAMEVWMFVVAATIAGAATAFFGPASERPALVLAERDRGARPGPRGPARRGPEPGWVFALDAVTYAVSAVFLALLPLARRKPPARTRFLSDLVQGGRSPPSASRVSARSTGRSRSS